MVEKVYESIQAGMRAKKVAQSFRVKGRKGKYVKLSTKHAKAKAGRKSQFASSSYMLDLETLSKKNLANFLKKSKRKTKKHVTNMSAFPYTHKNTPKF